MSKVCKKCGVELEDDVKFCPACGEAFEEVAEDTTPVNEQEQVVDEPVAEENTSQEPKQEVEETAETVTQEAQPEELPQDQQIQQQDQSQQETEQDKKEKKHKKEKKEKKVKESKKDKKEKKEKAPKPEKKCGTRKVTALGVIGTIFLSAFLVVYLLVFVCATALLGLVNSDLSDFGFSTFDAQQDKTSQTSLFDDQTVDAVMKILSSEQSITVDIGDGNTYTFQPKQEYAEVVDVAASVAEETKGEIDSIFDVIVEVVSIACFAIMGYSLVVAVIIIMFIVMLLGKSRRSLLVPGIIFVIIGLCALALTVVSVVVPSVFGIAAIEALLASNSMLLNLLICSVAFALIGALFTAIGATGRKVKN